MKVTHRVSQLHDFFIGRNGHSAITPLGTSANTAAHPGIRSPNVFVIPVAVINGGLTVATLRPVARIRFEKSTSSLWHTLSTGVWQNGPNSSQTSQRINMLCVASACTSLITYASGE